MHFSNLCAALGILRGDIASVLGIEQHLADAIDAGKADLDVRSLENATRRLQVRAGKPVDEYAEQDVLRAIRHDRDDNRDAPLLPELAEWERDANAELEANVDNAHEYLAKQGVHVGARKPRDDLRWWIVDKLKRKGAVIHAGITATGRIRLAGYAVKVPPPARS